MNKKILYGATIGDINGSTYEAGEPAKRKDVDLWIKGSRYTDDSVATFAVAKSLIESYKKESDSFDYELLKKRTISNFINFVKRYPNVGWGYKFFNWAIGPIHLPYHSFGNGSGMRISPVGWIARSEEEVKKLSAVITGVTHNHEDSFIAAEATAMCIYLAKTGRDKNCIKNYVKKHYYPLVDENDFDKLVANYTFDVSSIGTIPIAIYAFLISKDFIDCLRNCIAIGGDCDTLSAISCSIAEAYYGIDKDTVKKAEEYLDNEFIDIINKFNELHNFRKNK